MPPQEPPTISTTPPSPFGEFAPPSATQVTPPEPPKKSSKKKFVLIVGACMVLVSGTTAAVLLTDYFSRPVCLTTEDYKPLTGKTYDNSTLTSSEYFYTHIIEYNIDTQKYTDESKLATTNFIKKLGSFVKDRPEKLIQVTITSDYSSDADNESSLDRIYNLKIALQKAGVPDSSILLELPEYDPIDIPDEEGEPAPVARGSIAITSPANCR